ncbi:uncharacterized protein LOC120897159 [Anopheles arabiensis]|uniref:uncharacterized protein LOC120897159 n=1 Tax=Anopheles arabiensis TaxID=7173 RepID=UPI001AADA95E|nr:uncharacterized protein LOC120897159 [Anopheles arabiensis]
MKKLVCVLLFLRALQTASVYGDNHGCQVLLEGPNCPIEENNSNSSLAAACDGWLWDRRWIAVEKSCLPREWLRHNCTQDVKVTLTNLELVYVQLKVDRLIYHPSPNDTVLLLLLSRPFGGPFESELEVNPALSLHRNWIDETIRHEDAKDVARRQLERAVDTGGGGDLPAIAFMDFLKLLLVVSSLAGISFLFCCTFMLVSK